MFLRYVMVAITDLLDLDPINFFWVEEVGEFSLAWLTMIGAGIGIAERAHFTLHVLTHHLPIAAQRVIHVDQPSADRRVRRARRVVRDAAGDRQQHADLAGAADQPRLALCRGRRRRRADRRSTDCGWHSSRCRTPTELDEDAAAIAAGDD